MMHAYGAKLQCCASFRAELIQQLGFDTVDKDAMAFEGQVCSVVREAYLIDEFAFECLSDGFQDSAECLGRVLFAKRMLGRTSSNVCRCRGGAAKKIRLYILANALVKHSTDLLRKVCPPKRPCTRAIIAKRSVAQGEVAIVALIG